MRQRDGVGTLVVHTRTNTFLKFAHEITARDDKRENENVVIACIADKKFCTVG